MSADGGDQRPLTALAGKEESADWQALALPLPAPPASGPATTTPPLARQPSNAPRTPADRDADGLSDERERRLGTSPLDRDSDDDGLGDGRELLRTHTSPRRSDSDHDGLHDGLELAPLGRSPTRRAPSAEPTGAVSIATATRARTRTRGAATATATVWPTAARTEITTAAAIVARATPAGARGGDVLAGRVSQRERTRIRSCRPGRPHHRSLGSWSSHPSGNRDDPMKAAGTRAASSAGAYPG